MAESFVCEICQQELSLEEQSFDLEGACNNCALEENGFNCSCCGSHFNKEDCGSCDDICEECDSEEENEDG